MHIMLRKPKLNKAGGTWEGPHHVPECHLLQAASLSGD
jgi:hypothetical protein